MLHRLDIFGTWIYALEGLNLMFHAQEHVVFLHDLPIFAFIFLCPCFVIVVFFFCQFLFYSHMIYTNGWLQFFPNIVEFHLFLIPTSLHLYNIQNSQTSILINSKYLLCSTFETPYNHQPCQPLLHAVQLSTTSQLWENFYFLIIFNQYFNNSRSKKYFWI